MHPVIQQETTGCGIASCAAIAGLSYAQGRRIAHGIGIHADDRALWSNPGHVRRLLRELGIASAQGETPFTGWDALPDCALLATKWHLERSKPFWHWAVFVREPGGTYVLDSKPALKNHVRTDFGRIKPKWFIEVFNR